MVQVNARRWVEQSKASSCGGLAECFATRDEYFLEGAYRRSSNLSATLTESGVSAAPRLENYFVN
jgi:hypothetical protein